MKWKKRKEKIELAVFCLVLLTTLFLSSFLLTRQNSSSEFRVRNFFLEPEHSLDMVIVGSSLVYNGFSSPLAWQEQGFTSYVLGTAGAPMGITKSMIKEVKQRQDPKLIVVDLNAIIYNDKYEQREGMMRNWIDNMPKSENRDEVIKELVSEEERFAYYYPFLKYHDNWKKLPECVQTAWIDLKLRLTRQNLSAYGISNSTKKPNRKGLISVDHYDKKEELYPLSGKRFNELLDFLDAEQIDNVVFINMPRFYDQKMLHERRLVNQAMDILRKRGFSVYDLDKEIEKIGLNPDRDYFDKSHLNLFGQQKVTNYLAQRLNQEYQLSGDHQQDICARWDQEYESYQKVFSYFKEKWERDEKVTIDYVMVDRILSGS